MANITTLSSIAALKSHTGMSDGDIVAVAGYYAVGDNEIRFYRYHASSTASDNGGSVIDPNAAGNGRWLANWSPFSVKDFGAKGDGTTDDTAAINETIKVVNGNGGGSVSFPEGTYIIDDGTGIRVLDNIDLVGASRSGTILKMQDNAINDTHVVKINGGASVPWHTDRIANCGVYNLTVDGNRANHSRTTVNDGVTTSGDQTVTSASAPFTSQMVGDFIYIDRNRSRFAITNIEAAGSNAIITVPGHDFKVGDLIQVSGINATGDFATMNNNAFGIIAVARDFAEVDQSITVNKTLSTGSYTSGGNVDGGLLATTIKTFNSTTSVEVEDAPTLTTVQNGLIIEDGENGWGISILGADHVTVRDVTIKNCWGDGIYVDKEFGSNDQLSSSRHITIDNVDCDGNRRQGISLVNAQYVTIINSLLRNTGIDGVGPGAGLDIEPDNGICRYINVTDTVMADNNGAGLASSQIFQFKSSVPTDPPLPENIEKFGTWDIIIKGCHLLRNSFYGAQLFSANEGYILEGNTINHNRKGGILLRGSKDGKNYSQVKVLNNNISLNQFYKGNASDIDDDANGHGIVMSNIIDNQDENMNMKNILISGNTVSWNDGHGIYSSGKATEDVSIQSNNLMCNGQQADDTYSNLRVTGDNGSGLLIQNNTVFGRPTAPGQHPYLQSGSAVKSPKYGIDVTIGTTYASVISFNYVGQGGKTENMNVTNMLNSSAANNNYVYSNWGFKTESTVLSAAIDQNTTGAQTVTIAHGLDITPKLEDCTLTFIDDINGTPMTSTPVLNIPPYISAVDATNVTVKYDIGTTGSGNARIILRCGAANDK